MEVLTCGGGWFLFFFLAPHSSSAISAVTLTVTTHPAAAVAAHDLRLSALQSVPSHTVVPLLLEAHKVKDTLLCTLIKGSFILTVLIFRHISDSGRTDLTLISRHKTFCSYEGVYDAP